MTNTIAAAPPGFPTDIPISQETFKNWDLAIQVEDLWTCQPRNEEDVVTVCNWAAGAGFQVRPRGIMHTWSPITVAANTAAGAKILLVDTTQSLTSVQVTPAANGQPPQVWAQTGVTMDVLMVALEAAPGGTGAASGYSFAHIPAPGHLTLGGVLAINAHGTAIRTPPVDDLDISYGSMSNQILAFTAVVTDSSNPSVYVAKTFQRTDTDAKAFLTHLGRAFLLNVTLQVVDNYNLRCQSHVDIAASTLFAEPTSFNPMPQNSVADFLQQSGRVEVIWFPSFFLLPVPNPWLKVWTNTPEQPSSSRAVTSPYNYPFSDNLPLAITDLLKEILGGKPWLTPAFCMAFSTFTNAALEGNIPGIQSALDLWGPSKDTMIYVRDTTLRVTANGYAVQMTKSDVQQAIADFTQQFQTLLQQFQFRGKYPINSPLEIRITNLDDPSKIAATGAESPVISSLSQDAVAIENGWDVAVWFDVLTVLTDSDSQDAFDFYAQMERWFTTRFGTAARVMPEWSKGWAYTKAGGPWTDRAYMESIRQAFTTGRADGNNWAWEAQTLSKYDSAKLFHAPLLDLMFNG
ncbi:MAG: FAD-binding protein [Acidobacteriota bacterium]|nr:FAD-binding protein [Acidobacteriota bacterium]